MSDIFSYDRESVEIYLHVHYILPALIRVVFERIDGWRGIHNVLP